MKEEKVQGKFKTVAFVFIYLKHPYNLLLDSKAGCLGSYK